MANYQGQLDRFQFKPGVSGNPSGRPKGSVSIKQKIQEYLDTHPESVTEIVGHFVTKNKELTWQMLDGSPQKNSDITSGGKPLQVNLISFDDYDSSSIQAE